MARTRKTYTAEFKLQAVKMILEQKLSVAEVARRLGVGENVLHAWKKAALKGGTNAFPSREPSRPSKKRTADFAPRSSAWRRSATSYL